MNDEKLFIRTMVELRMILAGATLRTLLRKANFNPDQPRIPAGEPGGGRWTDGGDALNNPLIVSISENPSKRYIVDLRQHENYYGGHAIERHVGKTDAELLDRINTPDITIRRSWFGLTRQLEIGGQVGSFASLIHANDFVNLVLNSSANHWLVQKLERGELNELTLFQRFGYKTGKEAFRPSLHASAYIRATYAVYLVLRPDPQKPGRFRIVTAYPTNELPGRKTNDAVRDLSRVCSFSECRSRLFV